jgi:hypothetical protein
MYNGMTVGLGVVLITHPACADGTSYPSLRVEREEELVTIICLKDKDVNNPAGVIYLFPLTPTSHNQTGLF